MVRPLRYRHWTTSEVTHLWVRLQPLNSGRECPPQGQAHCIYWLALHSERSLPMKRATVNRAAEAVVVQACCTGRQDGGRWGLHKQL